MLAFRLGGLRLAATVGAVQCDAACDRRCCTVSTFLKQSGDYRYDKGTNDCNADQSEPNSKHADSHSLFPVLLNSSVHRLPHESLQFFTAHFAILSAHSRFSSAVKAVQFCVLYVDRSESEPDCKQDGSADDRDDDSEAEQVAQHLIDQHADDCEHD